MRFDDWTDAQLRHFYYEAQEQQDTRAIKAIQKEWNRRIKEA